MSRASFDTTRLDEECDRVAQIATNQTSYIVLGRDVYHLLAGTPALIPVPLPIREAVSHACRRPKMVPA